LQTRANAQDLQNQLFANSTDIFCNADMLIGKVWQFCQLRPEGGVLSLSKCQSLMRAATLCCA